MKNKYACFMADIYFVTKRMYFKLARGSKSGGSRYGTVDYLTLIVSQLWKEGQDDGIEHEE